MSIITVINKYFLCIKVQCSEEVSGFCVLFKHLFQTIWCPSHHGGLHGTQVAQTLGGCREVCWENQKQTTHLYCKMKVNTLTGVSNHAWGERSSEIYSCFFFFSPLDFWGHQLVGICHIREKLSQRAGSCWRRHLRRVWCVICINSPVRNRHGEKPSDVGTDSFFTDGSDPRHPPSPPHPSQEALSIWIELN